MAYGQLGMSEDEFWDMIPASFFLKMQGFYDFQKFLQNSQWDRTRTLASILLQPHLKKGRRIDPKKLIPLEWDKALNESKSDTPEKIEQNTRDLLYKWGELENPDKFKLHKIKNKK